MNQVLPRLEAITDAGASERLERYLEFNTVHAPYLSWQLEQFGPYLGHRILEVGCGVGGIIAQLGPRELVVGLDAQSDVLEAARARFIAREDCRFIHGDVVSLPDAQFEELRSLRFDTLVCINTLEHIRDDIQALQQFENLVAPGGHICLIVPAHNTLYGAYDRLDGHYRRYSKSYLRVVLTHTRLKALRMHYFNFIGALGWFFHYRLLGRRTHRSSHFRMMNAMMRIERPLERLLKPPMGLSLVAILKASEPPQTQTYRSDSSATFLPPGRHHNAVEPFRRTSRDL